MVESLTMLCLLPHDESSITSILQIINFEGLKTERNQMDEKWSDWLETATKLWNMTHMSHQSSTWIMWLINHCWVKWTTLNTSHKLSATKHNEQVRNNRGWKYFDISFSHQLIGQPCVEACSPPILFGHEPPLRSSGDKVGSIVRGHATWYTVFSYKSPKYVCECKSAIILGYF